MNRHENEQMVIAGPCAAEPEPDNILPSAEEALKRGIQIVRLSLFKPRTRNGTWSGMREEGIPYLLEIAEMDLVPATEVLLPQHAEKVMEGVLGKSSNTRLLLWIGARNQNQDVQEGIGRLVAGESRVKVMIKNPMWEGFDHWKGAVGYVKDGGAQDEQILLCHRGFAPQSNGLRNPPDFDLALRLKHETGLPMIVDPSHIAGFSPENVINMAKRAISYRLGINGNEIGFDGMIVEVHPNPSQAWTDSDQQLTWDQFDEVLQVIRDNKSTVVAKAGVV